MTNIVIVFEYGLPTVYCRRKDVCVEIIDLDRAHTDPDNYKEDLKRYEQILEAKSYKLIY